MIPDYPENNEEPRNVCLNAYSEGYRGAYDSVQRFVKRWKLEQETAPANTKAFIPLAFPPGETCQFDLGGLVRKIKVGHFRLCYSRKMFVVGYPCETQEMALDAHSRAFVFFGGRTATDGLRQP